MTWTTLTYAFGSQLTSTKMTQNQNNFTAVMTGDPSAPRLQPTALTSYTAVASYWLMGNRGGTIDVNTDEPIMRFRPLAHGLILASANFDPVAAGNLNWYVNSTSVYSASYGTAVTSLTTNLAVSPGDVVHAQFSSNFSVLVTSMSLHSGIAWPVVPMDIDTRWHY